MSNTTTSRPIFIPALLESLTPADFQSLKNGDYLIEMSTPNGELAELRMLLRDVKDNLREICFDLHTDRCNWDIKPGAADAFRDACFAHLKAAGIKGRLWGGGKSQITFSTIKGEEGGWMYKASLFLANPKNLVQLTFP